jgi:PPOX class probable F420-dependent enzyme
MELRQAVRMAAANEKSVLVTVRSSDGRPQLSNVLHHLADGALRISTTADRAKTKNLRKDPWAALHVNGSDFWSYVVIEGPVTLSEVAREPDDETVEELVAYYRSIRGEHPDWDEYRAAQVSERRLMIRLTPDRAYGIARD